MGVKTIRPENGKYIIKGKDKNNRERAIDLTLDAPKLDDYIVEQFDGDDMKSKHPDSTPEGVDWFACFTIYNKSNSGKGGPATVTYSFPVTLEPNQRFFVAYNNRNYVEVTDQIRSTGKVTLNEGDPATGTVP